MIKLNKLQPDADMHAKIQERIKKFNEIKSQGSEVPKPLLNAYNDKETKDLLKIETSEKCAYCESKMLHVDYGDIEHIVPKGDSAQLRFSYDNLTLACGICNTNKSIFLDVINPYEVDPADHLFACGPMVIRRPHSEQGLATEKRIKLNRPALLLRRSERIEALSVMGDLIANVSKESIRKVMLEELNSQCANDMEFSFVAKAYVKEVSERINQSKITSN